MSDLTERLREFALWVAPTTPKELVVSEAADLIAAIDALHQPGDVEDYWTESNDPYCLECGITWPCPTHRILHPEDGPTHE